jgi:hypothetical protein
MIPRHQAERYGRLPGTDPSDHRRHLDAGPHLAGQPAAAATAHGTWIKHFGLLERPARRCRAAEGTLHPRLRPRRQLKPGSLINAPGAATPSTEA